jgi:phosphoglycerate dehydrogenase-like enzyme
VQSSWAGLRPLAECPRRDYLLTGVKNIFGAPMTEFVLGWLLAVERRIPERARARSWDDSPDGHIHGKTIGIMGTGSIGAAVATGCIALGLQVRGLNTDGRDVTPFQRCWPVSERLSFARGLDYLVALLPDTDATNDIIDHALLGELNPGAILINGGRGNAVAMEHLEAALAEGSLRHAVLDVLREEPLAEESPLWRVPSLSITSHTAAPTPQSAIVELFCDNYRRYTEGAPLRHVIDLTRGY